VSATFHGRDLFAPVAAHLAAGASIAEAGDPRDPDQLVVLELPQPHYEDGALVAHALYVDRFGNVQLDVGHDDLAQVGLKLGHAVELEVGSWGRYQAVYVRTFADVAENELLVYEDAYRRLAVAVSRGDAARRLGLTVDDEVSIRPG
jgi:S-adenosylmethionine hydrolase